MCSIPGLPTPGLEAPVLITRVNLKSSHGLLEFWVNMDDGRKHIYEQMMEEIQTHQRKFCSSEGKPDDLCVVCISDTWYRARIVSIQGETYNVYLIDQGQVHSTTSEALAWSKSDSFLLPPEVESCILANVISLQKEWPETITKFLMCLPGKKFKGLIQHVLMPDRIILLEIPVLSNYMCKLRAAKKIKVDQFKELVKKCLHVVKEELSVSCLTQEPELDVSCNLAHYDCYFYPELTMDTFETVKVTEIIDPLKIFCMLLIFSKSVNLLSEQIQQHYEEASDFGQAQPQSCGDSCAARGTDGKWHRSLLKQNIATGQAAIEDDIEVFHVDEGKTELVKAENIKPLHGKFLKMPVVTYLCSLNQITHTDREEAADKTTDLKSKLLNQTVMARFDHYNKLQDVYYITLYAGNSACVKDIFLEKAVPISFSESEQNLNVQTDASLVPVLFEGKEVMDVCSETNKADGLQEETWPSTKQVGNSCAIGSTTSGIDNNHIKGNSLSVPLLHNSGALSTRLLSEVQNACDDGVFAVGKTVNVKVSCIESSQKFWCQSTESADSFRRLMEDLQAQYAFTHPQPLVESICIARNPDNKMWYRARIVEGHDIPTVDVRFIDYGQTQNIPLRDVRPIDPVFLQLEAQAFQCCLFSLKNSTEPKPVSCTDAKLTEFLKFVHLGMSSDSELKCVVKAVTYDEDGVLLNLVDIQRESESVCQLLAQKCSPSKASSNSSNAALPNGNLSTQELNRAEVMKKTEQKEDAHKNSLPQKEQEEAFDGRQPTLGVVSDKETVSETFSLASHSNLKMTQQSTDACPEAKGKVCKYKWPNVFQNVTVYAYASCIVGPHHFWCQYTSADELNIVSKFAEEAGHTQDVISPEELEPGSPCLALCPSDSLWYRAQVMQKADTTVKVLFVDYGNESEIDINNVKSLPYSLLEIPPHAFLCQLNGFIRSSGSWNDKVYDEFPSLLVNKPLKMTVIDLENDSEIAIPRYTVTMECNKLVINDVMQQYWKSFSVEPSVNDKTNISPPTIQTESYISNFASRENTSTSTFYVQEMAKNETKMVYASCISEPSFFWCQFANIEDLNKVSQLAQDAGQTKQDMVFSKSLGPGSPCLALFPCDNQWYRAQVLHIDKETLHVLFVDYGNESDVDLKNVRPLTQSLLEMAPHAFLCCLSEYDESKGSWEDEAYDVFNNLLVDKPLKLTVGSIKDHLETAVPQYLVEIEHEGVNINAAMLKYWKPVTEESSTTENPAVSYLHVSPDHTDPPHLCLSNKISKTTDMFKELVLSMDQTEMVYASCISEPSFFWCQFANTEDANKVSQLAQDAGQTEHDMVFSKSLGPGSPCLALFPSDNQWYRAQVLRAGVETLHVLFVDFGNESEVDLKNVRPLTQSLSEVFPQAFLCCLSGYDEFNGSWEDEAYDILYSLLVDKPLKLTVCNMKNHSETAVPQYSVDIEHEGININAAMLKYWKPLTEASFVQKRPTVDSFHVGPGHNDPLHFCAFNKISKKTDMFKEPVMSMDQTEAVYASCISEPGFFWCQFANTEDVNKVSQLAQDAGQTEHDMVFSKSLGPGSPCLALFPSDNQWHRAQVLRADETTLHVLFVDYGNESEVDLKNVRPLTQNLLEMAPQAFLCCLSGFDESKGSWEDEAYDVFYNLLVDKLLKLKVGSMKNHSETAVPQYSVEIEHGEVNINATMLKYWKSITEESSPTKNSTVGSLNVSPDHTDPPHFCVSNKISKKIDMFKEAMISRDQTEMVYASCISEPSFFWCQFANTEDINKVSQLAQDAGQTEHDMVFSKSLGPGSPCLALFPSDNQWYRAQVLRTDEETLHVLFVDYGNESEVDLKNVRPLTQSLSEMAPQAFLCCLSGFDESKGSWEDEACDVFYNLLVDKLLKLKVGSIKNHSETAVHQYSVEIEHEGTIVNLLMEKYWIAKGLETVDQDESLTIDKISGI